MVVSEGVHAAAKSGRHTVPKTQLISREPGAEWAVLCPSLLPLHSPLLSTVTFFPLSSLLRFTSFSNSLCILPLFLLLFLPSLSLTHPSPLISPFFCLTVSPQFPYQVYSLIHIPSLTPFSYILFIFPFPPLSLRFFPPLSLSFLSVFPFNLFPPTLPLTCFT